MLDLGDSPPAHPADMRDEGLISEGGTRKDLGGVPRSQRLLKGHLPRVIYHRVYQYTKNDIFEAIDTSRGRLLRLEWSDTKVYEPEIWNPLAEPRPMGQGSHGSGEPHPPTRQPSLAARHPSPFTLLP